MGIGLNISNAAFQWDPQAHPLRDSGACGRARLILNPFALRRWSWSWRLDSRRLYATSSVGQSNLLADTGSGGEDISTCEVIGFQKEKSAE